RSGLNGSRDVFGAGPAGAGGTGALGAAAAAAAGAAAPLGTADDAGVLPPPPVNILKAKYSTSTAPAIASMMTARRLLADAFRGVGSLITSLLQELRCRSCPC